MNEQNINPCIFGLGNPNNAYSQYFSGRSWLKMLTVERLVTANVTFEVTKRYFIDGFNSYATATNEETAFEALAKLKDLKLTEERLKEIKGNDDFICLLKEASQAA